MMGRTQYSKGTDSPPSLSLTASPEKTTEKKLINLSLATKSKNAGAEQLSKRAPLAFKCHECDDRAAEFLRYTKTPEFGNCSACGAFQDQTAILRAYKSGYHDGALREHLVEGVRTPD